MLRHNLREVDGNIVCNADKIDIFVPKYYFEYGMAVNIGMVVHSFGVLPARVYNKDKVLYTRVINLPTKIQLFPKERSEWKGILMPNTPEYDCIVLTFYRNDVIMPSRAVSDSDNVVDFMKILTTGKLLPLVPYGKIVEMWEKNLEMNGVSLGVPIGVLGVIVSSVYRDKLNPNMRYVDAWKKNPDKDPLEYVTASMREIAARSSTFAAITFEDQDAMLTSALNNTKLNRQERISPVEKIIKM